MWDERHIFMEDWNKLRKENDELYRKMAEVQAANEELELENMRKMASASIKKGTRKSITGMPSMNKVQRQPSVNQPTFDNDDMNDRSEKSMNMNLSISPTKITNADDNSLNASPLKATGGMDIFINLIEAAKEEVLYKVELLNEKLNNKDGFVVEIVSQAESKIKLVESKVTQ